MSKAIEITVGDEDRVIEVIDYSVSKGSKGHTDPTFGCAGCPPEPPELNDIQCVWQDTRQPLTDEEFETHMQRIEDEIWELLSDYEPDNEPRDD